MDTSTGTCSPFDFDITRTTRTVAVCLAGFALAAVPASWAAAQSLDSTVEEQLETDVTDALEEQVEDEIETDVTDTIEDQVEADVAGTVEDQVEADVAGTVQDEVQDQVESDVAGAVEEQVQGQVETDVTSTVEAQVESGVGDTVERQIQSNVIDAVEREVEAGVLGTAEENVAADVRETVEQQLGLLLGNELGEELNGLVDQVAGLVVELGIDDIGEAIETAVARTGPVGDGGAGADAAKAADARYVAGVDALGRAAEYDVWVILVPNRHADRIRDWGFTVHERRELRGLDRVLLRVDAPDHRDIVQATLELALDAPGTSVDFNHVYRAGTGVHAEGAVGAGGGAGQEDRKPRVRAKPLEIGIVDSRVATDHEALAGADIVQQDFVPFPGERPTAHGTAVASILVGDWPSRRGVMAGARLHAASVFFEDEHGSDAATTSSVVSALEWLAARGIDVVNMSLAGPPNRVLKAAIEALAEREVVVVAAVGNNGPSGEPLYPAAYEGVVGVTAVDAANRVYLYASRGRQVMFAAPGVDVPVARSRGGYAKQTGTSMAAPYAAGLIATSLAADGAPAVRVLERLQAAAIDLGDEAFDEVYGFGLIAAPDEARAGSGSRTNRVSGGRSLRTPR